MNTALLPRLALLLALSLAAPATVNAQDAARTVPVQLTSPTHEFTGHLVEYDAVEYLVGLRAGQRLDVGLATSNVSNCFDLYLPGAEKPFYQGGVSGNRHAFTAATAGEYRIRVYLLRLAARDGQMADYTLTLAQQSP